MTKKEKAAASNSEESAKQSKKQFWQTRVHIKDIGTVQGEVDKEHLKAFKAIISKDTDMSKWIGDKDPIEEQRKERAKIAKARREGKIE